MKIVSLLGSPRPRRTRLWHHIVPTIESEVFSVASMFLMLQEDMKELKEDI